jgi:hypothetical protein
MKQDRKDVQSAFAESKVCNTMSVRGSCSIHRVEKNKECYSISFSPLVALGQLRVVLALKLPVAVPLPVTARLCHAP